MSNDMTSLAFATLLILLVGSIVILIKLPRWKDAPLGKATTVVLVANVLILLYLLSCSFPFGPPFPRFADFGITGLAEAFAVTPVLTIFSLTILKFLKDCAPVVVFLIVVNVLLAVFVFWVIASSF